ncbi:YihA family ribosome biogenesis GTP-binding protein [Desulfofundulus sp. TPOSR]|jgi:GTP-binding protein|uniref:Probable GTP-binding protein EngB n=1 Tax=Desulfofundulus kuznetsovii (strain DSM 6115 / VKM B-1805 / 17) TaxID=760568 RepID=A0AAU8P8D9_DESK7|nr:ribosome biogenesis GTP-binding protein YihA/YsxC [Desulfofundulus sp. TPOSR]AEG14025.1 GTP-binding protein engB [Desulfofundulus kuznetsovii DSM 6115]NHM26315.1 YihA family ribosome biogenesis GTP-binding protein [Desulfofundulus sp. TPOSR]
MNIVSAEFVKSVVDLQRCPAGGRPEVALAGRSNVGKSSLLNCLVNRRNLARTSNTPGRTRTLNFYLINNRFYLVDLPGYGYARVPEKMRASWGPLIEGYLSRRPELRGVIQIVDLRHPPTAQDVQLYQWLKHHHLPAVVVATKADKLSKSQGLRQLLVVRQTLGLTGDDPLIKFSARTREGRDELWRVIEGWIN